MKKFLHSNDIFVVPVIVLGLLTIPAQPSPAPPSPTAVSPRLRNPNTFGNSCAVCLPGNNRHGDHQRRQEVCCRRHASCNRGNFMYRKLPIYLRVSAIDSNGGVTAVSIIPADSNGYLTASRFPLIPSLSAAPQPASGFKATAFPT